MNTSIKQSIASWISNRGPLLGIVGSTCILLGFVLSAIFFVGYSGEPYSLLNHFVSELGITSMNATAIFFNAGLVAGGILLLLFVTWLGDKLHTKAGQILGIISAAGACGVGIFSAEGDNPVLFTGHVITAFTFFLGGMLTILVFTIALLRQPASEKILHAAFAIAGFVVVGIFACFLINVFSSGGEGSEGLVGLLEARPAFLAPALLEWLVVLAVNGWLLAVSLYLHVRRL